MSDSTTDTISKNSSLYDGEDDIEKVCVNKDKTCEDALSADKDKTCEDALLADKISTELADEIEDHNHEEIGATWEECIVARKVQFDTNDDKHRTEEIHDDAGNGNTKKGSSILRKEQKDTHALPNGMESKNHNICTDEKRQLAEDDDGDDSESDDGDDPVMTDEDKRAMYDAVKNGDLFLFEDLLNKPNANINMQLYGLNLLMVAIRADAEFMCEYLIDNGVDYNCNTTYVDIQEKTGVKTVQVYKISCRQMAFDRGLLGVAEIIDLKNNDLFPFISPAARVSRIWQPKPPELDYLDENEEDEDSENVRSDLDDTEEERINPRNQTIYRTQKVQSASGLSDVDSGIRSFENINTPRSETREDNKSDIQECVNQCSSPDEGYGTTSPKTSVSLSPSNNRRSAEQRQYFSRPTKASMIMKSRFRLNNNEKYNESSEQIRISSRGSYHAESRLWHSSSPQSLTRSVSGTDAADNVHQNSGALVRTQSPWHDDINIPLNRTTTPVWFRPGPVSTKKSLPKLMNNQHQYGSGMSSVDKNASTPLAVYISGNDAMRIQKKRQCNILPKFPTSEPRTVSSRRKRDRILLISTQ